MEAARRKLMMPVLAVMLLFVGREVGCSPAKETPAPGPGNTGKKITFRLSSNVAKKEIDDNKSPMARGLNSWIKTVQDASAGTIEVRLYTDGQLANNTEQIVTGIKSGAFEVSHFATGNWAEYTDAFTELNVPYLYSSFEVVHGVMDSEIGTGMFAKLEKDVPGIKALAFIDLGFRHITNSKKPIKTPDDMKGLKLRTMNDKLQMAAMQALGATVTPLSISELYGALQQHIVDAQENPLSTIYSNKFYEVNKYCTLTRHSYTSTFMFMNKTTYESLSENQKKAVEAANKACTEASRLAARGSEDDYAALLTKAGLQIYTPTNSEMAQFQAAASKSWNVVQKSLGDERYNKLIKKAEEFSKK